MPEYCKKVRSKELKPRSNYRTRRKSLDLAEGSAALGSIAASRAASTATTATTVAGVVVTELGSSSSVEGAAASEFDPPPSLRGGRRLGGRIGTRTSQAQPNMLLIPLLNLKLLLGKY